MQEKSRSESHQLRAAIAIVLLVTLSAVAFREDVLRAAEFQLATHMIFEHALFFSIGALSVLAGEMALGSLTSAVRARRKGRESLEIRALGTWRDALRIVFLRIRGPVWIGTAVLLMAFWHLPDSFDLAARQEQVHILQHLSFVVVGISGFVATRKFGDSLRIVLLLMIIGMMGFAGLGFVLIDAPTYQEYTVADHNRAGDYMIISSLVLLTVGLPAFLIRKTMSYARAMNRGSR